jgi:hypothetical protein
MPSALISLSTEPVDTPGRRLPTRRRRAPSRPHGAAPETPGNSYRGVASGCAARSCPPASPGSVAVAVAPVLALVAALAVAGPAQPFDVELHQTLRDVANHLAQQVGVGRGPGRRESDTARERRPLSSSRGRRRCVSNVRARQGRATASRFKTLASRRENVLSAGRTRAHVFIAVRESRRARGRRVRASAST